MGAAASVSPRDVDVGDDMLVDKLSRMIEAHPDKDYEKLLRLSREKAALRAAATTPVAASATTPSTVVDSVTSGNPTRFDWSALLGRELLNGSSGLVSTNTALGSVSKVVLYFGGSWCAPCRTFSAVLKSCYAARQAAVEVVFVSSDDDEESFHAYRGEMGPWPCVPYSGDDGEIRRRALQDAYGIKSYPMALVLDGATGAVVSTDGRSLVQTLFKAPPTRTQKPGFCGIQATLDAHNALRALHGAPPLRWSDDCADAALAAARENKAKNSMFHNNCKEYGHGQNLFAYIGGEPKSEADAVQAWYEEVNVPGYPFGDLKTAPEGTGHFTQVIWRGTTHVGMASAGDPKTGVFLAANYSPAGNYEGKYGLNVIAQGATVPPDPGTGGLAGAEAIAAVKRAVASRSGAGRSGGLAGGGSGGGDGKTTLTLVGGPGVAASTELKGFLAKLPDFVVQSAPQVVTNITESLKKSGVKVVIELDSTSITTSVTEGTTTKTTNMSWG